jgi:hypothetical protein
MVASNANRGSHGIGQHHDSGSAGPFPGRSYLGRRAPGGSARFRRSAPARPSHLCPQVPSVWPPAVRHYRPAWITVVHIYANALKYLVIGIPPVSEQKSIVRFLDRSDRRVRRHIRAKQKLIKLLEEERQIIIQRAVMCGLDPNIRLKPSGVEWIGSVPEHWRVRRAKYLLREIDQRSSTGVEELLSLRMYRGLVPHKDVSTTPVSPNALVGYKKVCPGQLVMNRMRAAIGMFGVAAYSPASDRLAASAFILIHFPFSAPLGCTTIADPGAFSFPTKQ